MKWKKQGLFLYCIFTFRCFMFYLLDFVFSFLLPGWKLMITSGPNLLKAFNKQTVLGKTGIFSFVKAHNSYYDEESDKSCC